MERATGNEHRLPGPEGVVDDMDLVCADGRTEFLDGRRSDGWPLVSEMDDALHPASVVHAERAHSQFEASKEIAGKQRFGEPNRTFACGAAEPDARKIDLQPGVL